MLHGLKYRYCRSMRVPTTLRVEIQFAIEPENTPMIW